MKGISAVIAIILILMITVALAAMAYVWFSGVFESVTEGAEGKVDQVSEAMETSFSIESAANVTLTDVTVSIRNTGTTDIDMTKVEAYVNDVPVSEYENKDGTLTPGSVKAFNITISDACDKVLKLTDPTSGSQTTTIVCP